MKVIMYHYVRQDEPSLPHFRHLHIDDFRLQLDYLERAFGFIPKDKFLASITDKTAPPKGVVLTFDDGLKDHARFVLPELQKRNLFGIFYIPTGMYQSGKLLGPHRIHMLLGKYGGEEIFGALKNIVSDDMLPFSSREEFKTLTYRRHQDDDTTKLVKRTLNYFIDEHYREPVLDKLMGQFLPHESEFARDYYLSPEDLKKLSAEGMMVGSHGAHHAVMSKLPRAEQEEEITSSFDFLEETIGGLSPRTYCHPYGDPLSFDGDTLDILKEANCLFSFAVEARDVEKADLIGRPQALPRYDCNLFPHGQVRSLAPLS